MTLTKFCLPLIVLPLLVLGACSEKTPANAASKTVALTGAGASFPAPLYSTWFKQYSTANPHVRIDYQSVGSGAGVKQTISGLVDFGASDAAMTDEEMAKVGRGVKLLPMTAGGVVVVYHLDGVEGLRLSREALAGIFLGEIKTWNDAKIAAANPGAKLPDQRIAVIRRADGSGTTFAFTTHLTAISDTWKTKYGAQKSIDWPEGFIGGKGNEGVTANVKQTAGSIGYVEFGYAEQNQLATASLQNKAGKFVKPSIASCQAALANVTLPANLRAFLPDPEGDDSFPIVTYTWILAYDSYPADKLAEFQKLMRWCLTDGQSACAGLGYVPLPKNVVDRVLKVVDALAAG